MLRRGGRAVRETRFGSQNVRTRNVHVVPTETARSRCCHSSTSTAGRAAPSLRDRLA